MTEPVVEFDASTLLLDHPDLVNPRDLNFEIFGDMTTPAGSSSSLHAPVVQPIPRSQPLQLAAGNLWVEAVTAQWIECVLPQTERRVRLLRVPAEDFYTCSGVLEPTPGPRQPRLCYKPQLEAARGNVHLQFLYEESHALAPESTAPWSAYPAPFRDVLAPLLDQPLHFLKFHRGKLDHCAAALELPQPAQLIQLVLQELLQPHELARHSRAHQSVRLIEQQIGWPAARVQYRQWETRYTQQGQRTLPQETPHLALWQQLGVVEQDRRPPCESFSSRRLRHILSELARVVYTPSNSPPRDAPESLYDQLMQRLEQQDILMLDNCQRCMDDTLLARLEQDARWFLLPGQPVQQSAHFASHRLPLVVIRDCHLLMPGELCNRLTELYLRPMPPSDQHHDGPPMLPKLLLEGDFSCDTLTCNDIRAALGDFPLATQPLQPTAELLSVPAYRFWERVVAPAPMDNPHYQCPMLEMLYQQIGTSVEHCVELPVNCHEVRFPDRVAAWRHQRQPLGIVLNTPGVYFTITDVYLLWQRDQHLWIQAPSLEHLLTRAPFRDYRVY